MVRAVVMSCMLSMSQVGMAFRPTGDDIQQIALVGFAGVLGYRLHQQGIKNMDSLIDFCIDRNAQCYTPEARQFIQQTVKNCGVTANVTAITGLVSGKEDISWSATIGKNDVYYLNIPFASVSFLNDAVKKMNNNEKLTEDENTRLHILLFLINHEMNHVKRMVAGTSVASRDYSINKALVGWIGFLGLSMYLKHKYALSYNQQVLLELLLYVPYISYASKKHCAEEAACDIEGIDNPDYLRGGKEWLLTDCKNYVDDLFATKLSWLQSWYQKYPDAVCSLMTSHPHPLARAEQLDKKMAELEQKHAQSPMVAL